MRNAPETGGESPSPSEEVFGTAVLHVVNACDRLTNLDLRLPYFVGMRRFSSSSKCWTTTICEGVPVASPPAAFIIGNCRHTSQ